jgi:N-acyl-D-amino-acid deacylase
MSEQYDLIIRDATIVDGTGSAAYEGSVAVKGERISAIGDVKGDAAQVIDAAGRVVCPGFVDPHNHADMTILQHPLAENLVMQGITTFVGGNCALSPAPIKDVDVLLGLMGLHKVDLDLDWRTFGQWLSKLDRTGISLNYVPLVGHSAVRTAVLGNDFKRTASAGEIEEMQGYVAEAMESGAFGFSTFLDPSPGEYAALEEVIALARVAGQYGGLYAPHTRHIQSQWPSDDPEEYGYGIFHGPAEDVWVGRYRGYLEAIEISRQAGLPLHIAHLSTAFHTPQPHADDLDAAAAQATLDIIDSANAEGLDVTFDTIPISSSIGSERPLVNEFVGSRNIALAWLNELGAEGFVEGLRTGDLREKIKSVYDAGRLKLGMIHTKADPYWMDCFTILRCANKAYEGMTVGAIAAQRKADPVDVVLDILAEDPHATWVQHMDRRMLPAVIPVFLQHPRGMPCTDMVAFPREPEPEGKPAAIAYGLYAHYIGTYVRDEPALSLEEAIKKATSLPAQRFGLKNRGVLSPGAYADIVLFDLDSIRMAGDFMDPAQPPEGIATVLVNGTVVWDGKKHTNARPGKALRRN